MTDQTADEPGESSALVSSGSTVDIAASTGSAVESSGEAGVSEHQIVDGRYATGPQKGKFAKGHSGNVGGRPKAKTTGTLTKELEGIVDRAELARSLWHLSQGKTKDGRKVARPNLSVQLAAIQTIYDRIDGKAVQQLHHEMDDLPSFIIMHGRDAAAARDAEQARAPETNGHAPPVA